MESVEASPLLNPGLLLSVVDQLLNPHALQDWHNEEPDTSVSHKPEDAGRKKKESK